MKKKLLILTILILSLMLIVGCPGPIGDGGDGGDDGDGPVTSPYHDYYVNVVDEEEDSLTADSIILMDSENNVIDGDINKPSYNFTDLTTGTYKLIVAKEGFISHVEDHYLDADETVEITLNSGEDTVTNTITVEDDNGDPLSDVDVEVYNTHEKLVTEAGDTTDSNGQFEVTGLTRGVVYEYKLNKSGINVAESIFNLDDGSYTFTLSSSTETEGPIIQERFYSNDDKEISLGTIPDGEEVIVGISPLVLEADNTQKYPAEINVHRTQKNIRNNVFVFSQDKEKDVKNRNIKQIQSANISNYSRISEEQMEADRLMREQEEALDIDSNKLRQDIRLKGTTASAPQTCDFYGFKFDDSEEERTTIPSTLERETENVLLYVADDASLTDDELDEIEDNMENIFHTNMQYFSGRDSYSSTYYDYDVNGKVIVLFYDMDTDEDNDGGIVAGYHDSNNYTDEPDSNQADMIYVNSYAVTEPGFGMNTALGTLAHEFQHLLFFMEKEFYAERDLDDTWINEGFSTLAEHLNGYYGPDDIANDIRVHYYFNFDLGTDYDDGMENTPLESLVNWEQEYDDYGSTGLFALYLYNKCGPDIISEIYSSKDDPIDVISDYSTSEYYDFSDLLMDWAATNYVNDDDVADKFRYHTSGGQEFELGIWPVAEELTDDNDTFDVKATGVKYYSIEGDGSNIDISIDIDEDTGVIIYNP